MHSITEFSFVDCVTLSSQAWNLYRESLQFVIGPLSVVLYERSQPTVTKSFISFLRYIMMNATHQASRPLALISIDIAGGMITGTNTLTMSESLPFFSCRFIFRE